MLRATTTLLRDVDNLRNFFGRFAPELLTTDYGLEILDLYQRGALDTDVALTGTYVRDERAVDLEGVLADIEDARLEEADRLLRMS
jgi:RIO kinase 1